MNFLAHLYLSNHDEDIMIGNFIADAVKGQPSALAHKPRIIEGIHLHRQIDTYTDSHPIVLQSVHRLRAHQGKFAGIVVDIAYDHFLAKNWHLYSKEELFDFVEHCYELFRRRGEDLPEKVHFFLPYMMKSNWLYNYRSLEGIDKVFKGMSGRTPYESNLAIAIEDIKKDYDLYEQEFFNYFPELISFVQNKNSIWKK